MSGHRAVWPCGFCARNRFGLRQQEPCKEMKNDYIKRLVLSLPIDSPYLQELRRRFFPRKKTLSPDEALAFALRDPAFESHFVLAYFRANQTLPPQVTSWSMWRLYSLLRYG